MEIGSVVGLVKGFDREGEMEGARGWFVATGCWLFANRVGNVGKSDDLRG